MTLSAVLVKCVLRAQELCPPVNSHSQGHLFRHPLLCSESVCKQNTDKWKEERSYLLVLVGTCRILGWIPECSVFLIKGSRDPALAFISPWNWLIISLAEFVCWLPDFLSYSSVPFQVNVFPPEFSGYLLPVSQPS